MSSVDASTVAGATDTPFASSRKRFAGLLWAALAVSVFSGWFVITRFSVTRELRISQASTAEIALQAFYQGVLMSGVAIFTFNRAVSLLGSAAATALIVAGVLLASRRPSAAEQPRPQGRAS